MTAEEDAPVLYTSIHTSKCNSLLKKTANFTQQRSQLLLLFHKISMLQYIMQHLLYQSVSVVLYLSTVNLWNGKAYKNYTTTQAQHPSMYHHTIYMR